MNFFCVFWVVACVAVPPKRTMMVYESDFPEEIRNGWHPRLVALLDAQKDLDFEHGMFAPNLDYELYSKPPLNHYEDTPMGRLTLDRKISFGQFSAVFSVRENPLLVIKYQSNCGRQNVPHPALLDFWGLRESARANVQKIPTVYFVSPAVRMPRKRTTKCDFGIRDSEWKKCDESAVRFMVIEKCGVSLEHIHRFSGLAFSPRTAIKYGIQLMETLKQIHLAGLVHGDIHVGNILVDKNHDIRLIDFDRFRFITPSGLLVRVAEPFSRVHISLSPWELEGFACDVRDDIFRAVSLVAELMHPFLPYTLMLQKMRPTDLYAWKTHGLLFSSIPTEFVGDNWGVSDSLTLARLREIFDEILFIARSPTVQIPVNHNLLIALFQRVDWILSLVTVS